MSMEKAKRFFELYPDSRYGDRLAAEIVEWCRQDGTGECRRMALEALPKDHPRRVELADVSENVDGKPFGR